MDIKALAEKYESYIIDRRRYYHAHPELSGEEKETREAIVRDLHSLGITDITEMKNSFGLVAVIHGAKPGKTIGLRADIDALPVKEETGLPFASVCEGKMHACGHDGHIAIILGAAKILSELRGELCGNVKLIFQPCEEFASGARWLTDEHATDDIDALYGNHIWGELDAPLIDITPGNRMAAADLFDIEVYGKSAHGAQPNLGIDTISIACAIVTSLQQCVSRMNDPLNPLVLTIGEFTGGPRFNVIAEHVHMRGTTRYFAADTDIEGKMRRVIENTAQALGGRAELKYMYKSPAVINKDERLNAIARNAVIKLFGEEAIGSQKATMGGEDFPLLAAPNGAPFFYSFLGCRNESTGMVYTNHQSGFSVDEATLKRGTALMAQFAVDFLNG